MATEGCCGCGCCHGLTSTQCVCSHHATMRCNPATETYLHVPGHPGVETPGDPGTLQSSMTHSCESSRARAKDHRTRHASDQVHDFLRDLWHQATILHHEAVHPELNHLHDFSVICGIGRATICYTTVRTRSITITISTRAVVLACHDLLCDAAETAPAECSVRLPEFVPVTEALVT